MVLPKTYGIAKGWPLAPGQTPPTLQALTLSASVIAAHAEPGDIIGAILGRTPGSTITSSDPRAAVVGDNLVVGGTPAELGAAFIVELVETHSEAGNSPHTSTVGLVAEDEPTLFEVLSVQRGGGNGGVSGKWNVPATASADTGALVAIMAGTVGVSAFTDSAGGTWTKVGEKADHGVLTIFKRMVGAQAIVAGVTTFGIQTSVGYSNMAVEVVCVPAATGIPTTIDAVAANQPVPPGVNMGGTAGIVGPSSAGSLQIAGYRTYLCDNTCPAFGSDDSWQFLRKFIDSAEYGNSNSATTVVWRKAGSTPDGTALAYATPANSYHVVFWTEVAAPDTGESGPPAPGGGGDGGLITTTSQLVASLGAGVAVNGGKTFTLDGADFGELVLQNYNFTSNPVTFEGQEGTELQAISLKNCHGIIFKKAKVYGVGGNTGAGICLSTGTTDCILDGVCCDSGTAQGAQISGTAFKIIGCPGAGSNNQIIGRRDNDLPDVWGYGNAVSITSSGGVTLKDLTCDNFGRDGILLAGATDVLVDGVFGRNTWANIAEGDHPDWMQWFSYGGQEPTRITIQNCGWMRDMATATQGYFGEDGNEIAVIDCWLYGGLLNSGSLSRTQGGLYDGCYFAGYADYGSRIIIRGGSDSVTVQNCLVSAVVNYTDGTPNTNINFANNTLLSSVTPGVFTGLDAWLAGKPNVRGRT